MSEAPSPPSAAPRPRRKRLAYWLLALSVLGVAGALARPMVDPWLRSQTRVQLESLLASLLQGQVHIDCVASLTGGGVLVEGVTVLDGRGRRVLYARQLSLGLNLFALLRGTLHFSHGKLSDVQLLAIPSETAAITLFDALSPRPDPTPQPASSSWLTVLFDHIHVVRAELHGDIPGLANVEAKALEARGRIQVDDELHVAVSQARTDLVRPYERPIALEQATLALHTGPLRITGNFRVAQRSDRVRAHLEYRSPDAGDDALDLVLELAPVSADLLFNLGVGPAQVLVPVLRGHARLIGPTRQLGYRAALISDAGSVSIVGTFPEAGGVDLHFSSEQIRIAELIAYAPPVDLTLSVRATGGPDEPATISASVPELSVFGVQMHDAFVAGFYENDRFQFKNARVGYAGGRFNLSGWVDNDADLYVRVRSHVPEVARDPTVRSTGLSAGLVTDVMVARAGDALSFEGKVTVERFHYKALSADVLSFEGEADFDEDYSKPKLRLTGHGSGVAVAGYMLGDMTFRGVGARGSYSSRVTAVDTAGRSAALDLALARHGESYRFLASRFELSVPGHDTWRAQADVTLSPDGVQIDKLQLSSGPQDLQMKGSYSYSRAYRVDASLQRFDLGGLRELLALDLADLDGTVDGTLALTGVPDHPRIDARGSLQHGVFLGMTDLTVLLSLVFADGRFDLDTEIVLPDKSRLAVYTGGAPGPGNTWLDQIGSGNYQFKLDFERVPFAVSKPWLAWLGITPPPGNISAKVRGAGTFSDPQIDISSHVQGLELAGYPMLDIDLDLAHDGLQLGLHHLQIADEHGELVRAAGSVTAKLAELFDIDGLRSSLATRPFELKVKTPLRRLDELPASVRVDVPIPAVFQAVLAQSPSGPTLDVNALLGFPSEGSGIAACDGTLRRPELALHMTTAGDKGTGTLGLRMDGQPLGEANLETDLPLLAWLTGEQAISLPRTGFTMSAQTLASEEIPIVCEYLAGPIAVKASATDAFVVPPNLRFEVHSRALQLAPHEAQRQRLGNLRNAHTMGQPFAADVSFAFEGEQLTFRGSVTEQSKGSLLVQGVIPSAAFLPEAKRRAGPLPIEISIEARKLQLSPFSIAFPVPVRSAGQIDGKAGFRYDLRQKRVELSGELLLSKGALGIAPLGQQLSEVELQLVLRGNVIRVERMSMRDFDGTAKVTGDLTLETPTDLRADLRLEFADFPIRSEGAQVSKLTGKLGLRAEIDPAATRAELIVKDLRVNLPSDLELGLQDLDPHPQHRGRG